MGADRESLSGSIDFWREAETRSNRWALAHLAFSGVGLASLAGEMFASSPEIPVDTWSALLAAGTAVNFVVAHSDFKKAMHAAEVADAKTPDTQLFDQDQGEGF